MNTTTNTRGVSEAMRDAVAKAVADVIGHGMREKCYAHADAAIAALSAEPAAQGDADLAGYVDPEQVADMQRNGGGVSIGSFSERYGRTVPVYFRPAPPAQPAEVEATLRRILERGKHRTDGELSTLLDRVEHMTRGDQDLIAMQRTEIRLMDEKAAQPAERVPEGWVLVPREPTAAMADAFGSMATRGFHDCYADMLAATPAAPAEGDGKEGVR